MVNYSDVLKYNVVYIYKLNYDTHKGFLKVGKATLSSNKSIDQIKTNSEELLKAAQARIKQQTKTAMVEPEILYVDLAVKKIQCADGTIQIMPFLDKDVHDVYKRSGFKYKTFIDSGKQSEWYEIDLENAIKGIEACKANNLVITDKITIPKVESLKDPIELRKEQEENINITLEKLKTYDEMLWDCKMRYGKTITAYEVIKRGKFKKVIVITHRPAVEDGWEDDHKIIFRDGENIFIDKTKGSFGAEGEAIDSQNDEILDEYINAGKDFVYFASIQDLRGSKIVGGKYNKNNRVFAIDWDLVIVDEAHEGTQTDLGEEVFTKLVKKSKRILLSGTPYNIRDGFSDNVYTWTYIDEQRAKAEWDELFPDKKNPYADLPTMNILTFELSNELDNSYRYVTENMAFSFREFFRVWTGDINVDFCRIPEGCQKGDFVHKEDVISFLNLITKESVDSLYPFSNENFRNMFKHTFWLLPGVAAAKALASLLKEHPVFKHYRIVNIAGENNDEAPYDEALKLVKDSIKNYPYTITLSCGKLTTGVTVREWTGAMMLSGSASTSASGYMQAIFRVQSPGVIDGKQKTNCYVFDFAPDRALKVIADAHSINSKGRHSDNDNKQVLKDFLNFCPVISVEGTEMRHYDVPELMRQIKRIVVDNAVNSGFDDNSVYKTDAGLIRDEFDEDILRKLSDIVVPQKRGSRQTKVVIADHGLTKEDRAKLQEIKKKKPIEYTQEEKELKEKERKQKEEQKKMFDLLRNISIRLPLLFYGADADITKIIHMKDFLNIVDDESWAEFMPKGLTKNFFKQILKYYDEDVITQAGLRIRRLAKAADDLPPTKRAMRIVEIISKFKNPDKETVLTPWNVVNMHLGTTVGGYNFFKDGKEIDEPELIDNGEITEDVFLNKDVKVLELNSKSGLYPLYMAYSIYMLNINGKEKDNSIEDARAIWNKTLEDNIYVLCKTKMAQSITKRTLVGYTGAKTNTIYLTKLVSERMKDIPKLCKKLRNPERWGKKGETMKFDVVVGNPPYQGENHQQIYPYFYLTAINAGENVSMIFPTGWQLPKNANNLSKLNNKEVKQDKQIVKIDNRQNVFAGISGAEWVNIILWKKGYDNGLDGKQLVYTNGENPKEVELKFEQSGVQKPKELIQLKDLVRNKYEFKSLQAETSQLKPYGLRTDVFRDCSKYNLEEMQIEKLAPTDITVIGLRQKRYIPFDYKLPKTTTRMNKYKVFVPYAWGNMSESAGLGGAFADIIIAYPKDICTETYLESGCFDTLKEAKYHAKYLMTKFARAMLFLNKTSQHSTTAWGDVPVQDYKEEWWEKSIEEIDEELSLKYDIPLDIREFINNNIQTRTEVNIIGFKTE